MAFDYLGTVGNWNADLAAPSGTNRAAVIFITCESSVSRLPLTALTWGTEDILGYVKDSITSSAATAACEHSVLVGPIPESIIAAQNGLAMAATWTGTPGTNRFSVIFFNDAAGATIPTTSSTYIDAGQTISRTLTVPSGSFMVAGVTRNYHSSVTDDTWTGGTELWDYDVSTTNATTGAYSASAPSQPQTMTADWTASATDRSAAMIAAVVSVSSTASIAPLANYYRMLRNA